MHFLPQVDRYSKLGLLHATQTLDEIEVQGVFNAFVASRSKWQRFDIASICLAIFQTNHELPFSGSATEHQNITLTQVSFFSQQDLSPSFSPRMCIFTATCALDS